METDHDVLVATARARCETACVIREEVIDGYDVDVDGRCCHVVRSDGYDLRWRLLLRGAEMLSGLRHVSFMGFISVWAVFCYQGGVEPWP